MPCCRECSLKVRRRDCRGRATALLNVAIRGPGEDGEGAGEGAAQQIAIRSGPLEENGDALIVGAEDGDLRTGGGDVKEAPDLHDEEELVLKLNGAGVNEDGDNGGLVPQECGVGVDGGARGLGGGSRGDGLAKVQDGLRAFVVSDVEGGRGKIVDRLTFCVGDGDVFNDEAGLKAQRGGLAGRRCRMGRRGAAGGGWRGAAGERDGSLGRGPGRWKEWKVSARRALRRVHQHLITARWRWAC